MTQAFIGIGSNAGDAEVQVALALAHLSGRLDLRRAAPCRSPAQGFDGAPFVNVVAATCTDLALPELLAFLKTTEIRLGKDLTRPRYADKKVDIDLLYLGDVVIENDRFTLPAGDANSPYYLQGMFELAPEWTDPRSGKTIEQLWAHAERSNLTTVTLPPTDAASIQVVRSRVRIDDLRISLHLGVTERERATPQDVLIHVAFEFSALPGAVTSDDVEATLNYSTLARGLTRDLQNTRFKTLERLVHQAAVALAGSITHSGTLVLGARKFPSTPGLEGGAQFEMEIQLP